jgi:hypothetical protein
VTLVAGMSAVLVKAAYTVVCASMPVVEERAVNMCGLVPVVLTVDILVHIQQCIQVLAAGVGRALALAMVMLLHVLVAGAVGARCWWKGCGIGR